MMGAKGADNDKQLTEKEAEGRKSGDTRKATEKGDEGRRHLLGQPAGSLYQPAGITLQDVARRQEKGRFDQAVMHQTQHGAVGADASHARAEGDDAMFSMLE